MSPNSEVDKMSSSKDDPKGGKESPPMALMLEGRAIVSESPELARYLKETPGLEEIVIDEARSLTDAFNDATLTIDFDLDDDEPAILIEVRRTSWNDHSLRHYLQIALDSSAKAMDIGGLIVTLPGA